MFSQKHKLLEKQEDAEDVLEAKRVLSEIKSGKQKLYSIKEFEEKTGIKLKK